MSTGNYLSDIVQRFTPGEEYVLHTEVSHGQHQGGTEVGGCQREYRLFIENNPFPAVIISDENLLFDTSRERDKHPREALDAMLATLSTYLAPSRKLVPKSNQDTHLLARTTFEVQGYVIPRLTQDPRDHKGVLSQWVQTFYQKNNLSAPSGVKWWNHQRLRKHFSDMQNQYGITVDRIFPKNPYLK